MPNAGPLPVPRCRDVEQHEFVNFLVVKDPDRVDGVADIFGIPEFGRLHQPAPRSKRLGMTRVFSISDPLHEIAEKQHSIPMALFRMKLGAHKIVVLKCRGECSRAIRYLEQDVCLSLSTRPLEGCAKSNQRLFGNSTDRRLARGILWLGNIHRGISARQSYGRPVSSGKEPSVWNVVSPQFRGAGSEMLKTRVIPSLLLRGAGLVKTTEFRNPKYVGDPINAIRIFNDKEVDETRAARHHGIADRQGAGIRHDRKYCQRMFHARSLWRRNHVC